MTKTTTTQQTQAAPVSATVEYIDPVTAVIDDNIRTVVQLDPTFVAQIKSEGVRVPVLARRDDDGIVRAWDGQRRLLAAREAGWIANAVDVDCRTQARTLSEVDEMGLDRIAGALDIPADSFDLDVQVQQPADVAERLAQTAELERDAQAAVSRAASDRCEAARTLRDAYGLSAIDAARPQRHPRPRLPAPGRPRQSLRITAPVSSSNESTD